jgi:hypothetical protein
MAPLHAGPAHRALAGLARIVAGLVWAVRTIEIIPEFLADAPEQMADLLVRMWPPDLGLLPGAVHAALIETLHIATLGTLFSFVLAVPLALLAARNICRIPALNALAQLMLVSSRSVNSLVWALIFVAVFGPGAAAGTFAIAFRSVGFVGKLLAEALEETSPAPSRRCEAAGAPWGQPDAQGRLAAGAAGLLGHRAVPLGHQRARERRARPGRRGRHRRRARRRHQLLPVGPRGDGAAGDPRGGDRRGGRGHPHPGPPDLTPMRDSFDLLVIGGGVNGAGIARDAQGRGLSTCLAERGDLAARPPRPAPS